MVGGEVRFGEVARAWVRAEKASPRFAALYASASENPSEDEAIELLGHARGWPDRDYFEGFPPHVVWYRVELTADELRSVLYIDWDYWIEVTAGTRLPADAIERMGWNEWLLPDAVEPIVIVADSLGAPSRLVVLEGHARLTRFVAAAQNLPPTIECWLGVSPEMAAWGCY